MTHQKTRRTDEILGPSVQLSIMLLLYTHAKVQFTTLQRLLGLSPGNLSHHLSRLAGAGYVEISKRFSLRRPLTVIAVTPEGREAFQRYVEEFKEVISRIESKVVRE